MWMGAMNSEGEIQEGLQSHNPVLLRLSDLTPNTAPEASPRLSMLPPFGKSDLTVPLTVPLPETHPTMKILYLLFLGVFFAPVSLWRTVF